MKGDQRRGGNERGRTIISSCWVSTVCDFETALLEAAVVVVVDYQRVPRIVSVLREGVHVCCRRRTILGEGCMRVG